jgi:hypothetical protein
VAECSGMGWRNGSEQGGGINRIAMAGSTGILSSNHITDAQEIENTPSQKIFFSPNVTGDFAPTSANLDLLYWEVGQFDFRRYDWDS